MPFWLQQHWTHSPFTTTGSEKDGVPDAGEEGEAIGIVREVGVLTDQAHGCDAVTAATTQKGRINGQES